MPTDNILDCVWLKDFKNNNDKNNNTALVKMLQLHTKIIQ